MNNSEYISASDVRKKYKITSNTLRSWAIQGKIKFVRPNNAKRLYFSEDIKRIFGDDQKERKVFLYARVSSSKQKEDLERQEALLKEKYKEGYLISDIGSGLNWKRKNFLSLLESILKGDVQEVVVTYKDRLCRFGFELFEYVCSFHDTKIVVLDKNNIEKEETEELQEDLLSIITFFTARHHGRRSNKNKQLLSHNKGTLS